MKRNFGRVSRINMLIAAAAMLFLWASGAVSFAARLPIYVGAAEIFAGVLVFAAAIAAGKIRKKRAESLIDTFVKEMPEHISENALTSMPMPVTVTYADGTILWYNDDFAKLFEGGNMRDLNLSAVLPQVKWGNILRTNDGTSRVTINRRTYDLISRLVKNDPAKAAGEDEFYVYIYLLDRTKEISVVEAYQNEKTDVAVICLDNYDEIFQRMNDAEEQQVSSEIKAAINKWAAESGAVLKKLDRDRYYMFFEHKHLKKYIDNKFDIITNIRKAGEKVKQPVSASIGIGVGEGLSANEQSARNALDMAQGRGGDQVGVKTGNQFKFYGNSSREYEKSTRVKTRAVAVALKEYIQNSDKVIFMGHKNPDYDCFGAAMGLQRAVRACGKKPYIINDRHSEAVKKLYDELTADPEYDGMFIDEDDALERLTDKTLVVVLDTHRPTMLESRKVAEAAKVIVLIDHHRRATEFIDNCSLIYHEPYASSTCEMATELLQYMSIGSAITAEEAKCLYTGILLDTKNFIIKTSVRTFEAASYLRRLGLNTSDVKRLFNVDKDEYDRRAEIVKTATEIAPSFAVAYTKEEWPNIRVIASQAADEMLNINQVKASFVIYPSDGRTCVSARSISDVNVHVIMEALGGGGHATVAGAQRDDVDTKQMIELIKKAVDDYIKASK